ncbi:spermidine synthase [Streptomyces pristinaespiralis ATCC 25486]|uniref:Spermidine synthase n=1 Tax=Streptomyces pristinaespiralis (strain ATCC 25486 / DSM 40338 / CBS 914.69 / JCM 4507 / KCC S-0507 / NBRC 13074 / NRRL 2958 / 5647) TaxID=457429 RepID=D6X996_STRE2|nr:spermidine synthase [Streptomyces pristinaespiralis ATCC 25486]
MLIAAEGHAPQLGIGADAPRLRSEVEDTLTQDTYAAERTRLTGLLPSTLVHPRYTR